MSGKRSPAPAPAIERMLEALGFNGISANFRPIMTLEEPRRAGYRKILRELDRALGLAPESARLLALQGKALSNLSFYEPARRALERSLALDGADAQARAWLGETHLLENRADAALEEMNRALALDPGCAWASFGRAAARIIRGETSGAAAELRRLAGAGADGDARLAARALLGLLDAQAGRFRAALAHIDAVRSRTRGRSWPLVLRAAVHRLRGDRRAALRDLDAALAANPAGWLHAERALLREDLARLDGAAADLMEARPEDRLLLESDGLLQKGRPKEALAALREAVRAGSSDPRVYERLGRLLERAGRRSEAEDAYRTACSLKPARLHPYFQLAGLLLSRGDRRGMEKVLRDAQWRTREDSGGGVESLIDRFQLAACRSDNVEAARAGELLLDRTRRLEHLEGLTVPLLPDDGAAMPDALKRYARQALAKAAAFAAGRPGSPWGGYIRHLWGARLAGNGPAPSFRPFPAARYGWMHARPGCALLYEGKFREAVRHLKTARDFSRPADWRCQCLIGEALAFQGKWPAAMKAFRSAETLAGEARGQASAWKAAALLWGGRYRQSLSTLDGVPPEAESPYAACWRGAALSRLGRFAEALAALDAAILRFPNDGEARAWRAETLLRMGRARGAIQEADAALERDLGSDFIFAVRGLARAARGDAAGLRADMERISAAELEAARRRLGAEEGPEEDRAAVLEELLTLSRGIRRTDVQQAVRLGRGPARGGNFL